MPTNDEVRLLWSRAFDIANDIVQERRPAPEAARELDRLRSDLVRLEHALRPFVGLAAEWEHDPARRSAVEQEVVSAAESLRRRFGA